MESKDAKAQVQSAIDELLSQLEAGKSEAPARGMRQPGCPKDRAHGKAIR